MNAPITQQTFDAYRICEQEAKKSGKPVVRGGWALNRDDAWDLLDELSEDPRVQHLKLKLLKSVAEREGLDAVMSELTICGWPVIMWTEGPTTIGLTVS
jgi:hypothetical protein